MAIVASGITSSGARYTIHDDAYIHCTPAEIAMRRDAANRAAHAILVSYAQRQREAHRNEETDVHGDVLGAGTERAGR